MVYQRKKPRKLVGQPTSVSAEELINKSGGLSESLSQEEIDKIKYDIGLYKDKVTSHGNVTERTRLDKIGISSFTDPKLVEVYDKHSVDLYCLLVNDAPHMNSSLQPLIAARVRAVMMAIYYFNKGMEQGPMTKKGIKLMELSLKFDKQQATIAKDFHTLAHDMKEKDNKESDDWLTTTGESPE